MGQRVTITAGAVTVEAELFDTPTAEKITAALPIEGSVNRWGGEIYFTVPIDAAAEPDGRDVLQAGELGYWPPGKAFCVFFGPTPASNGDEIRAASNVNVFGKVIGDMSSLWDIDDGATALVETKA